MGRIYHTRLAATRYPHAGSVSELYAPVVSICLTKRRRFAWAAWWSGAPSKEPFRPPDAHGGGARTPEAAHEEAAKVAGISLRIVESFWARAWTRVLVGQAPFSTRITSAPPPAATNASIWTTLEVAPNASAAELKRAFRRRSLETHPDQGGSEEAFRALVAAYTEASKRITRPRRRRGGS